jgi:isocitrate dehydrogenase
MTDGDFRHSETSFTAAEATTLRIEHVAADCTVDRAQGALPVLEGEIVDAAVMRRARARRVPGRADRRRQGARRAVLRAPEGDDDEGLDPIIFGTPCAPTSPTCSPSTATPRGRRRRPQQRAGQRAHRAREAARRQREAIEQAISATYETGPRSRWSTPTAASQPARAARRDHRRLDARDDPVVRADVERRGEQQDAKCVIPDSVYAALYAETIDFCREHGAFDPTTMGTTPNVGLMAQKAEEYGSHDKTFEIARRRRVRVVDGAGDAARARRRGGRHLARLPDQGRADPRLGAAGRRARPRDRRAAVFWLDETAAHDARCSPRCAPSSPSSTRRAAIEILPVAEATRFTLERAKRGEDTISVTGNVLRDYLTTSSRSWSSARARRCSRSCR